MHNQIAQKKEQIASHKELEEKLKKINFISSLGRLTYAIALVLIFLGVILGFYLNRVEAQTPPENLFLVPEVHSTSKGPQLGHGIINSDSMTYINAVENNNSDSSLNPNPYTPANYIPPQYDPFNWDYKKPIILPENRVDIAPFADFIITTLNGMGDNFSGTTRTPFVFDANSSYDNETSSSLLEVRWDFENDGKLDSYFSRIKSIQHTFKKAGIYNVKMEVLDQSGHISTAIKQVTVVENTAPSAYFTVNQSTGTAKSIFSFDTSLSADSQYFNNTLIYRFDWNSDNTWDTNYENKTRWNHRFDQVGKFLVTMEVMDPEGATSKAKITVETMEDNKPVASFIIERLTRNNTTNLNQYFFDASTSKDDHTQMGKLLYRWDFNYTGINDIVFDTQFSTSATYSGKYFLGGHKVIRLQVMDEEGNLDDTFASIDVPWL